MTIRTRLLIILPLLVLLMNLVAFFLFQSSNRVQDSYNLTMKRVLLYQNTVSASDQSLKQLYAFLLHPVESMTPREAVPADSTLSGVRTELKANGTIQTGTSILTGFVHLTETLSEQMDQSFHLAVQGNSEQALSRYLAAEKTAGFIRSEAQRLTDTELAFFQPVYENIHRENAKLFGYGIAVFAFGTALTLALASWISRSVTKPVTELMKVASRVSAGELDVTLPENPSNDEIGSLYRSINHMLEELKRSIERDNDLHEKERLVKTLELEALQSQIHPHFLFNTLNVLSKLALLENAEQTSDLIVSLSNLLRYNLQTLDRPVTIRDELRHVQEYIAIQKARFRDRVSFELTVDESMLDRSVPSLLLQPLVENAFTHGIADMVSGAVISIDVRGEGLDLLLTVRDNGKGMSEETRRALLSDAQPSSLSKGASTGIGTRNVFKRLELLYNRNDLVAIESSPGHGTTVRLIIPAAGKDNTDVPNSPSR
ncbi:sensor histidine kinase [Gorillibacterium timonense]|uniref:sensor histidine kinase n=1 Tax=Gorillibacterium timonense TaxID=1689269 RepID=UPI00071D2B7B|nr:sensor histidine kinase [Gorillibacterium timonense]